MIEKLILLVITVSMTRASCKIYERIMPEKGQLDNQNNYLTISHGLTRALDCLPTHVEKFQKYFEYLILIEMLSQDFC